jgi:hypothetical protein
MGKYILFYINFLEREMLTSIKIYLTKTNKQSGITSILLTVGSNAEQSDMFNMKSNVRSSRSQMLIITLPVMYLYSLAKINSTPTIVVALLI